MIRDEIIDYYRAMRELDRLASGHGRLEFLRTWDIITRELPLAPASILDVGGATGVYAGPLAEHGYQVHVVDPVPQHVDAAAELSTRISVAGATASGPSPSIDEVAARRREDVVKGGRGRNPPIPGVSASIGDARALHQADGDFDAVLLLGPLYHLHERVDRVQAWAEARRVVRPGGVVIGATISRYASFLDGVSREFARDPAFRAVVDRDVADGRHYNPDNVPGWFTTAYFQHSDEIPGEVADAGLTLRRMVPVETAAAFAREGIAEVVDNPELLRWTLDVMRRIEDDPTLLGATPHVLTIAVRD
jgi:SAM-dependent methyltransferase